MIVGIDVGIKGAIALLNGDHLVWVKDMPTVTKVVGGRKRTRIDARTLYEMIEDQHIDHAFIEIVGAMPNQGVTSMFAFGQASGIAEGVCACVTPNVTGVRPQTWKKHFKLGSDKVQSRLLASHLFAEHADRFNRVKDDGRAEAALIGLWGCETLWGKV